MSFPLRPEKYHVSIDVSIDGSDLAKTPISDETNIVHSLGPKKRYMIIDETKLPNDEAERLLAKRAYNRQCADRARKRSKETVKELLQQVQELHADKVELRRTLAAKEREIQLLEDSNKVLLSKLTQLVDIYPQNNSTGLSAKTVFPFKVDSFEQQSFSTLSLPERRGSSDRMSASFLPSWYRHQLS